MFMLQIIRLIIWIILKKLSKLKKIDTKGYVIIFFWPNTYFFLEFSQQKAWDLGLECF